MPRARRPEASPGARVDRRLALLLVAATIVAYLPALSAGFIWDDDSYVTGNPFLLDLGGLAKVWVPGHTPQYYPAVFTGFWIERQLYGLQPFGYHLVNVLLHAFCALLVWRLARQLALPGAWFVAAVFALHPVHVESVAWVTERKNVQSGLFYLLAALAYRRFERERDAPAPDGAAREPWASYATSLACFLLALLSKTVTCTLPAALVLIRLWRREPVTWRKLAPLVPFVVAGIGLALVTVHLERSEVGASGAEFDLGLAERLLVASRALLFYPLKLLIPWPLAFVYPRWELLPGSVASWWPAATVLAVAAAAALAWRAGRRGPALALAFFAGTLLPALGFFDVYPMRYSFVADHFQYLASLGVIALVVGAMATHAPRRLGLAAGAAALVVLAGLTWRQAAVYADAETLWRATLRHNPSAWMAHTNLAKLLTERGEHEEALEHLRRALAADPSRGAADQIHFNVGLMLGKLGRHDEALEQFRRLQASEGGMELRMAGCLERLGRDDEAEAQFRAVLAGPGAEEALVPFGLHLLRRGRPEEAVEWIARAVAAHPDDDDTLMFHADACAAAGRLDEAIASAGRALSIARARGDARAAELIAVRLAQLRESRG